MKQVLLTVINYHTVLSYLEKAGDGRKMLEMIFYLGLGTQQMHAI